MRETTPENWSAAFADSDVIERRLLVLGTVVSVREIKKSDLDRVVDFPRGHHYPIGKFRVVDISPKGTRVIIENESTGKRNGMSAYVAASILRDCEAGR